MRSAQLLPSGTWDPARGRDQVWIDFDRRHRRRIVLRTEAGHDLLLDLPQAARLRHGDGLLLDDGGIVVVQARPEPLLDIHAHDAAALVRIAWHLGNRHQAAQICADHLFIRREPVLKDMLEGLNASVVEIDGPFDPEGGAYGGAHNDHHEHEAPTADHGTDHHAHD